VQHFIRPCGYLAICTLMMAQPAGIPIPFEVTMPFAGAAGEQAQRRERVPEGKLT
jgi:membrane protein DedA with SNARE-associated domain